MKEYLVMIKLKTSEEVAVVESALNETLIIAGFEDAEIVKIEECK